VENQFPEDLKDAMVVVIAVHSEWDRFRPMQSVAAVVWSSWAARSRRWWSAA
jgi:hypothetical protein